MDWLEFVTPEIVDLSVFIASLCTILIFMGMVVRYVLTFVKNSKVSWQAWLALALQTVIAILVAIYAEPKWISFIVIWVMIAVNELNRRAYKQITDEYRDIAKELLNLVQESLDHSDDA